MTCYIIQYYRNTLPCIHRDKDVSKSLIIDMCIETFYSLVQS